MEWEVFKMALKVNYVDDILNTSKNTKRKYNMIQNSDGTVSFEDVTDYKQVGDSFGSADVNAQNKEINKIGNTSISGIGDGTLTGAVSEMNSSLVADGTPFRFGKDSEGNFGYIITDSTGADTVIPFKKNQSMNLELTEVRTTSIIYNLNVTIGDYYFIDIVYLSGGFGYNPGILSGADIVWSRLKPSVVSGAGYLGHFIGVVQATATVIALRTGDAIVNGNVMSVLCYAKID